MFQVSDETLVRRFVILGTSGGTYYATEKEHTMEHTRDDFEDLGGPFTDVPLILEDLLCQIEELRATDGDEDVIADLLAQVELLQGR